MSTSSRLFGKQDLESWCVWFLAVERFRVNTSSQMPSTVNRPSLVGMCVKSACNGVAGFSISIEGRVAGPTNGTRVWVDLGHCALR